MTRFRTLLLLILISLVVTISIRMTELMTREEPAATAQQTGQTIDYSVQSFSLSSLGKDGQTQYHLTADRMNHYRDSDITLVTQPSLELYRPDNERWNIIAQRGDIAPGGETVILTGEVRITRSQTNDPKSLIITTDRLKIEPNKNLVSTEALVTMETGGARLESKGMLADLNQETIEMLSQVRGTYHASP